MGTQFTLGDGGIETALEARLGQVLPQFEAYTLLNSEEGRAALHDYYRPFIEFADARKLPLALDTPTWRANPDWMTAIDGDASKLEAINADAVAFVREFADRLSPHVPIAINGVVGPRYDDFVADQRMSAEEAEEYHGPQVRALAEAGADRVTSVTTLDVAEGLGVVRAAAAARIPAIVSFTVGSDGKLADGSTLAEAIRALDDAAEAAAPAAAMPAGYAVNCAHPEEVLRGIDPHAKETERIIALRLNAARHDEDGSGDEPALFSAAMAQLADRVPSAQIFGGCCGTDVPHIDAIANALSRRRA